MEYSIHGMWVIINKLFFYCNKSNTMALNNLKKQ